MAEGGLHDDDEKRGRCLSFLATTAKSKESYARNMTNGY